MPNVFTRPNTDIALPTRVALRQLRQLPRTNVSTNERALPNRAVLLKESEEPNVVESNTLSVFGKFTR
jgi:hypothetical protein